MFPDTQRDPKFVLGSTPRSHFVLMGCLLFDDLIWAVLLSLKSCIVFEPIRLSSVSPCTVIGVHVTLAIKRAMVVSGRRMSASWNDVMVFMLFGSCIVDGSRG